MAADVVQYGLYNVGQHAEFGHHRRGGAAQVVKPERLDLSLGQSAVEVGLANTPAREPAAPYKFILARLALQNGSNLIGDWKFVLPFIFHPLGWEDY
jgi:hypothetical protein